MPPRNMLLVRRMGEDGKLQLRMKKDLEAEELLAILRGIAARYAELEEEEKKMDEILYILTETMESAVEDASL